MQKHRSASPPSAVRHPPSVQPYLNTALWLVQLRRKRKATFRASWQPQLAHYVEYVGVQAESIDRYIQPERNAVDSVPSFPERLEAEAFNERTCVVQGRAVLTGCAASGLGWARPRWVAMGGVGELKRMPLHTLATMAMAACCRSAPVHAGLPHSLALFEGACERGRNGSRKRSE